MAGSIHGLFVLLAALGAALGGGKKQNAAAAAPVTTPAASLSALVKVAAKSTARPANGGTYPNADAILARLAAAGLACPGPSPMAGANVFYPGAASLTACNSPDGQAQDSSAEVFDTAAHLAEYKTDTTTNPIDSTAVVADVNWAFNSANFSYAQRVHALFGGRISFAAASTAAPASSASTQTPAQQAYAGQMLAAGFFPGTPDWIVDGDGDAVCGSLQTESMSDEVSCEESVDENSDTGMTTKADILTFVRASVNAWCPQYAPELPAE